MGYSVNQHCGPSSSRPPPRVPDCIFRLLFKVHHPHPFQQPHRNYSQRSPHAPCHPILWHPHKTPLRQQQRVHQLHMDQTPALSRGPAGPHFTYHPEGNAINERSHRILNNMLHARLLEGPSTKAWVEKVPGIMLTLNAMPHEPHGFSASMIATGREPTLPPDLISDASPPPTAEDASGYVETIQQRLQLTHQQMVIPPVTPAANPYQVGSLIFVLTTPPERTSKLAPRWKGPYRVCRIPNEYQVVYEDGKVECTIHINHAKPAEFTTPDLPEPVPPVEEPRPPLGYLPAGFTHRPSKPLPLL